MKILMVNVPFSGHVNPTLPLARELVSRGHNVSYILSAEWKEKIEATGAKFVPYAGGENLKIAFENGKPKNPLQAMKVWKYAYETIVSVGNEYDLLIYEFFTFTAFAAAKKIGINVVRQFSTFALNKENISSILVSKNAEVKLLNNKFIRKLMTKIVCGSIPLVTSDLISEIAEVPVEHNIVYTVREFQINNTSFDDRYCFVGPVMEKRKCEVEIPYEKMEGAIVYISMGTLQNEQLAIYKKCLEAFGNRSGLSVIMSIGKNTDIHALGTIPENFYVYSFVPQLEVLERSTVFISHGGMNSVNEGLYYANRFLVIPMDMDQYAVAKRVSQLKLGYSMDKEDVTADLLRKKVEQLLGDAEVEENVKEMSKIMQKSGGVKAAADYIEKVVS